MTTPTSRATAASLALAVAAALCGCGSGVIQSADSGGLDAFAPAGPDGGAATPPDAGALDASTPGDAADGRDAGPSACVTALAGDASFVGSAIDVPSPVFEAVWQMTPLASPMDSAIGLQQGLQAGFGYLATTVRFSTAGVLDVCSGTTVNNPPYEADARVTYAAGEAFRVRQVVNLPAHVYSVFVTPPGGSEIALARDYAFRASQSSVTSLTQWSAISYQGGITACLASIAPVEAAVLAAEPRALDFGSVAVGSTSSRAITVTNSGTVSAAVSAPAASGAGLSAASASLPGSIPPGESRTVTVTFAPSAAGAVAGSVSIASDAPGSPLRVPISAVATAVPPGVLPAFPGAEGGGARSEGGRGGAVYEVTNLSDSGTGSLRACIEATGRRTCVFRVGGTLQLSRELVIRNPYITIAGQTAPGSITIGCKNAVGTCLNVTATHDVIVRYLRVRRGFNANSGGGSFYVWNGSSNVIIDHLTCSWGQDECLTFWNAVDGTSPHDISVQNSMIYEGIYKGVPYEDHNNLSITGGNDSLTYATNVDFHHNLYASSVQRLPLFGGASGSFVNNLVFNWHNYATAAYLGVTWDVIGNRFKPGTMTPLPPDSRAFPFSLFIYDLSNSYHQITPIPTTSLYARDNTGLDGAVPSDPWSLTVMKTVEGSACRDQNGNASACAPVVAAWRRTAERAKPAGYVPITASSPAAAEAALLAEGGVGASRYLACDGTWVYYRDAQDLRLLADYQAGAGIAATYVNEDAVGGYPALPAVPGCDDVDHDGLPDAYEAASPCGTNACVDAQAAQPDGYTNLEKYLAGR